MEDLTTSNKAARVRWFRLAAIGLSLVFSLLVLEITVRVTLAARPNDIEALRRFEHAKRTAGELKMIHFVRLSKNPRMIYEMVPNVNGTFHDAPLRTNSAGFADRERPLKKPRDTFRIAVVGDSIAFGWGVAQEDRYSDLLERFLNESTTTATHYEVLNFGIPGYNTVMEAALLRDRVLAYDPDLLVLGYCADNDTSLPNFIVKPRPLLTLTHSYLWDVIKSRSVKPAKMALEGGVEYSDPANIPPEYEFLVGWAHAANALRDIAEVARQRNMPVVFLRDYYYLEPYRQETSATVADIGAPADALARQLGFVVVRPIEAMVRFLDAHSLHSFALSVAPDKGDAHPNPVRHALLARELYQALVENRLLPDAQQRDKNKEVDKARWEAIVEAALKKTRIEAENRRR
ncbi:MAG: SGNH/GDSL hydrolase family protein [Candidatus Sumerlaeaceae bacterium]